MVRATLGMNPAFVVISFFAALSLQCPILSPLRPLGRMSWVWQADRHRKREHAVTPLVDLTPSLVSPPFSDCQGAPRFQA